MRVSFNALATGPAELDSIDGGIPDSDDLCDDAPTRDTKEVERCAKYVGRRLKATGSNI